MLVFVDEKTRFKDFLNQNEIITYKNINDLATKIIKFNKNDKLRKNSKKGREKYHKFFNSTKIAEYIINKTFNFKLKIFLGKIINNVFNNYTNIK